MGIFSIKKKAEETKKSDIAPKQAKAAKKDKPAKPESKSMKDLYGETAPAVIKSGKDEKKARKYGRAYRILVKPLITEKATNLSGENKYLFMVEKNANKIEIAKAIDEVYGIKPTSVNIINIRGKNVRYGRTMGKRKSWKKAIIMLPKGKTINIYEGV